MSLNLTKENRVYKKLFHLKLPQRDGLILNLHHTKKSAQRTRFVHGCLNKSGNILVLADIEGNFFVIDFTARKFWNVLKVVGSCTVVEFSNFNENEILVGTKGGPIYVIDIQSGLKTGKLIGHQHPVTGVSYACNFLCMTSSLHEAIIWDMKSNSKAQVLNLNHPCTLKFVVFTPVTNDILACFNDDVIQIWEFSSYEMKIQIQPLVWFSHEVRNVTFTVDGKIMVLGCRSPHLALFLLSNFKLLKFITLPDFIQSIRHVDFIPQICDGGSNKILAILSGRGSVCFYDIDQNEITSELVASYEISKFGHGGNYLACVLCSGDVHVYDITQYIAPPTKLQPAKVKVPRKKNGIKKKSSIAREQIRDILDFEKMKLILRECGEYPDSYRVTIWEHLLQLPNNTDRYNAIINNRMIVSFEDLCEKYPLEDKRSLKNLKKLLDNLVTWSKFFLHVEYMPNFVFPFVKLFQNKPLICFEAVCTVITNWCQFWFEYFPLPPVNVLAMIENVFMEHDPELLNFLVLNNIQSKLYAWPILKSAYSEILTAKAWKTFWDHVITNEPSFLLCGVVAYNVLQRATLLSLKNVKQFECFYNTHHPVYVKKLIAKTYQIVNETSESIHPRQYLNNFQKLKLGEYPDFCDYPKTVLKSETALNAWEKELSSLKTDELDLFRRRLSSLEKLEDLEIAEEEKRRIVAMQDLITQQLLREQEKVTDYYERVADLRQKFHEEDDLLTSLQHKIATSYQFRDKKRYLGSLLEDIELSREEKGYAMTKTQEELLYHYSQLLKNKHKIQKLLGEESSTFANQQKELADEITLMQRRGKSEEDLKILNLATGIAAMDALIKKIEVELDKEKRGDAADSKVLELQAETKELVMEVNKLLNLLIEMRNDQFSG